MTDSAAVDPGSLAGALAETHRAAFASGGVWSAADFAGFLSDPTVTLHGDARCFALIRRIADEAEILTLATRPDLQRGGRARAMLAAACDAQRAAGTARIVLEVAEDNLAARTLYDRAGFTPVARRQGYYRRGDGSRVDALILARLL